MKKNKSKDFEVKFEGFGEETDVGTAEALLSKYNHIDSIDDMVVAGAYTETIALKPIIPLLADHNMSKQIGIAELFDTQEGLRIKMKFFLNTTLGMEKYQLVKASNESGLPMGTSIGFRLQECSWKEIDGRDIRILEKINLHECSITPFPCCEPCLVDSVKSKEDINVREVESCLRDAGLSKSQATKYSSLIKSELCDTADEVEQSTDEKVSDVEVIVEDNPQDDIKSEDVLLTELKDTLTILNLKTTMENF